MPGKRRRQTQRQKRWQKQWQTPAPAGRRQTLQYAAANAGPHRAPANAPIRSGKRRPSPVADKCCKTQRLKHFFVPGRPAPARRQRQIFTSSTFLQSMLDIFCKASYTKNAKRALHYGARRPAGMHKGPWRRPERVIVYQNADRAAAQGAQAEPKRTGRGGGGNPADHHQLRGRPVHRQPGAGLQDRPVFWAADRGSV